MGWQCSEILSVWQLLLEQRSPPTLVLLDQTPNTNGASCPSKVQVSPPSKPCNPMGPSPWICTLHQRLAPCSAADGSQSLQLEKRMCVGRGVLGLPLPNSTLWKLFLFLSPALGCQDSRGVAISHKQNLQRDVRRTA